MVDLDIRKDIRVPTSRVSNEDIDQISKMVHFNLRISSCATEKTHIIATAELNSESSEGANAQMQVESSRNYPIFKVEKANVKSVSSLDVGQEEITIDWPRK